MSKPVDREALCDESNFGGDNAYENPYMSLDHDDTGNAVKFSPGVGEVAFGTISTEPDRAISCNNARVKWIAIGVSIAAVCLLIIILGCVFMIHVYPNQQNNQDLGFCTNAPCTHGSTCVNGPSAYSCICAHGYTGTLCETDVNECASSPCSDGAATCRDVINGYECQCRAGFMGDRCEQDIDECLKSPCIDEAGTCVDGVNNFTCVCAHGYTGRYCESDVLECASDPCANGATCHEEVNGFTCQCDGGYTGQYCETDYNECLRNPCAGGATCIDGVNDYTCLCRAGTTGRHCERDIDECASSPCVNGATCHNLPNGHYCQCDDGFTGSYCENEHDECLSLPCLHEGTCTDHMGYYSCECVPGYTGPNCETDIDECASTPCQHGGQCISGLDTYFCRCQSGFVGKTCEQVVGTCPRGFTANSDEGRCYKVEEDRSMQLTNTDAQGMCQTFNATLASLETASEVQAVGSLFTWEGRYHVLGARRNSNDNRLYWNTGQLLPNNHPKWSSGEPTSYDCVSAIMRDGDTKLYSLDCSNARPYVCERSMIYPPGVSDCRIRPCLNGATCLNVSQGFNCICPAGFTGQYCTSDIDECGSNPCQNGGTCRDGFNEYACVCAEGYTGNNCETNINECVSNPCQAGGTCIDGINAFTCACAANRTGVTCNAGVDDPCPPDFTFYNIEARCYLVKETPSDEVSWQVAENLCQAHGSTLASLETAEEVDFVGGLFVRTGRYHLVSARREGGTFRWNTGATLSSQHPKWSSGNPSYEDCVAAINSDGRTSLYTMGCSYERPYVCEMQMLLPPGVNDCRSMPCRNGAECHTLPDNAYYCNCTTGYNGTQCEMDIDECSSDPCENGGTCENAPGTYSCQCVPGFTGLHCEFDIDECASNPCRNNATCIDNVNGYECDCLANYTGPSCQTSPNDPCPHNFFYYPTRARCYFVEESRDRQLNPDDAEIVCATMSAELASLETADEVQFVGAHYTWTGRYHIVGARRKPDSSFDWNSGASLPVSFSKWSSGEPGSGDCVSTIMNDNNTKLYTLSCSNARPYVCERPIRLPPGVHSCRSMPCLHGATCVEGNNSYTCQCPVGMSGQYCETDIDECASNPCQNGVCSDQRGYYKCECTAGYTGVNCETDIDDCASDPCANNGTCIDFVNSYTCVCVANYTGSRCVASVNDRCPAGFIHWVGGARCYFLQEGRSSQKSYSEAQTACRGMDAELASLETVEELDFVGQQFTWTGRYHVVGASEVGSSGAFRWDSGVELSLSHPRWSSDEPSYKQCVAVIYDSSVKLYGLSCSYARPYVCERGIL